MNESNLPKNTLSSLLLEKVDQQIELLNRLVSLVPQDKLEWQPAAGPLRICDLLGHLLECLAGFCAVLYAVNPERLKHFTSLKAKPVNHACSIDEAKSRIVEYEMCIREGFDPLTDHDLSKVLPTLFAKEGEAVLSLLLGNFEHLVNHKYQLFLYLRLLGIEVRTPDLYSIRET